MLGFRAKVGVRVGVEVRTRNCTLTCFCSRRGVGVEGYRGEMVAGGGVILVPAGTFHSY